MKKKNDGAKRDLHAHVENTQQMIVSIKKERRRQGEKRSREEHRAREKRQKYVVFYGIFQGNNTIEE